MAVFRIIHISDLHFSQHPSNESGLYGSSKAHAFLRSMFGRNKPFYPTSYSPDLAIKLSRQLGKRNDIDAILVTGDLATHGEDADLLEALNFFRGTVPREWCSSSPLPRLLNIAPTVILPGNHDRYVGTACLPGGTRFEKVFGEHWDADQGVMQMFSGKHVGHVVFEKGGEKLAICCADFTLQGVSDASVTGGWFGQGRVNQNVLLNLELMTDDLTKYNKGIGIVWAIHFPPINEDGNASLSLIDESLLAKSADDRGIKLIFAGHTHRARHYQVNGHKVNVICAGSATGYSEAVNSFYDVVLEVGDGEITQTFPTLFSWDENRCEFVK